MIVSNTPVSVCIATYNGSKFIQDQLDSILSQLGPEDEVIIVDDCSTDNTVEIIYSYSDPRIKLIKNEVNLGHTKTFSKALSLVNNEIIFFSDQDDIWIDDRVNIMKSVFFDPKVLLVTANSTFINQSGMEIDFPIDGVKESTSYNYLSNIFDIFIGKTNYYGCCMAFRKSLLKITFPIPSYVESHDLWFALASNILGRNRHLDFISLKRRIHGANSSVLKRNLSKKIYSRVIFFISIINILFRSIQNKIS